MKKLIAGLLLLTAAYLWADTKTTGSLGLLKPSTNQIDSTRSWADKINTNFEIIDSSVSGVINGSLSISGVVTSANWNTAKSTTVSIDQWNTAKSTNDTTNDAQTLAIGQRTVVGYNGASALGGNITSIKADTNLTATLSGTTMTLTATGGGGSVGNSTKTVNIFHSAGPVFLSSSNYVSSPGFGRQLSPCATYWFNSIWAYNLYSSSVTPPKYEIRIATSESSPPWAYVLRTPQIVWQTTPTVVGTPSLSIRYSTAFPIFPTEFIGIARTTVAVSGLAAHTDGINARGWSDETGCP